MATDGTGVKHVVVDSGGFIRNAPIKVTVCKPDNILIKCITCACSFVAKHVTVVV